MMYFFGTFAPGAAVGTVVPVVAHHEVVAARNDVGAPGVVRPILLGDEVVAERDLVAVHLSVLAPNRIVFLGDDAFDE